MPRKGRTNEEIVHALHRVEGAEKVTEVCRRLGISEQRVYRWRKQTSRSETKSKARHRSDGRATRDVRKLSNSSDRSTLGLSDGRGGRQLRVR